MNDIWYCNARVGVKTLGNMMSEISKKCELSQRYTNHSLRATAMSVLDDAGYQGRHIIRISGHKREESVKSYSHKLTNSRKRTMSDAVRNAIGVVPQNSSSNNSVPPPVPSPVPSVAMASSSAPAVEQNFFSMDWDLGMELPLETQPTIVPTSISTASNVAVVTGNVNDPTQDIWGDITDSEVVKLVDTLAGALSPPPPQRPCIRSRKPFSPVQPTMNFANCTVNIQFSNVQ